MASIFSIFLEILPIVKCLFLRIFKWKKLKRDWERLISYSDKVKSRITRTIPLIDKQIDLPILNNILQCLIEKNRIVVTGDAGVGKTGVLITLSEKASNANFIFIDARDIVNCKTIPEVSKVLRLSNIGLLECIEIRSRIQYLWKPVIVVVDQCDSIWRLQSRNLLLTLLGGLANISELGLIVVCRTHEAAGIKELIGKININVVELEVEELGEELATQVLNALGVIKPHSELVKISRNLFNLSLVGEIISKVGASSLKQVKTPQDFWERYRITLEQEIDNNDSQYQVTECAANYAKVCLVTLNGTCPISCNRSEEEMVLLSRGVLVKDEVYKQRYRFKHEKLRDYMYSFDAVHRRNIDLTEIQNELGEQAGLVAPVVMALYLKVDDGKAAEFMSEALRND